MMKSTLTEYRSMIDFIVDSDDESLKGYYSKCLNNPNLSPKMLAEILNREAELVKMANEKDTEKREFDWKLVGSISLALVTVVGISAGVLGGKFDFKLPKKS